MANGRWRDYLGCSREFDRWLDANAFLGSLLAIGMLAMALAGLYYGAPLDGSTEFSSVNELSK
jgi:hypothetical protein